MILSCIGWRVWKRHGRLERNVGRMKTIGLIGGLSWESSSEYYRIINQEVQKRLGGLHSAECLLYSFDFAEIEALQAAGAWGRGGGGDGKGGRERLAQAGAACIVICSNTMHRTAADIEAAVDLPLIHIADATAEPIVAAGFRRVALCWARDSRWSRISIRDG